MSAPQEQSGRRRAGLVALALILLLEALGAAVIAVLSLVASPLGTGVTSGIAVAVFILLIAALLVLVAVGAFRARPWIRSATLVWQLVQLLVGAYSLTGAGASLGFGVTAIALAAVALVLLFTGPVRAATERP